jgi:hypothetical protein
MAEGRLGHMRIGHGVAPPRNPRKVFPFMYIIIVYLCQPEVKTCSQFYGGHILYRSYECCLGHLMRDGSCVTLSPWPHGESTMCLTTPPALLIAHDRGGTPATSPCHHLPPGQSPPPPLRTLLTSPVMTPTTKTLTLTRLWGVTATRHNPCCPWPLPSDSDMNSSRQSDREGEETKH